MAEKITYYAIVDEFSNLDQPAGGPPAHQE